MKTFFKSKKGKTLIIIFIITALLVVGVGCYFIFRKKLILDYEKGARALDVVDNAQYAPDMDKFLEMNQEVAVSSCNSEVRPSYYYGSQYVPSQEYTTKMNKDDFANLIEDYGNVKNKSGMAKWEGYDIWEIKEEIRYVVKTVPAFNQWFRLPDMSTHNGFPYIPYYQFWTYYLDIDEQNHLSITRVSGATGGTGCLNFEDYSNIKLNLLTYEVMNTKYYFDENGDEVVECYFYCVAVDNVQNNHEYNGNPKDSYPLEFMYLKNVKDKSLVKYSVCVAYRYQGSPMGCYGYDLRGVTPYGITREFLVANYDGYEEVEFTKLDQRFATLKNPEYTGDISFNMSSNNIKDLVETVGLSLEEYESATDCKNLLDKISKQIVDNFEIKNKWMSIFKNSMTNAFEIKSIEGPLYGKEVVISNAKYNLTCNTDNISFSAEANVEKMSKFDKNKKYSLSCALKNKETGKIYILANNYVNFAAGTTFLPLKGSEFSTSSINIPENGVYEFVLVVVEEKDGKDVIMHDSRMTMIDKKFKGLVIPNSVDENGIEHKYEVLGGNGKLIVTVSNAE